MNTDIEKVSYIIGRQIGGDFKKQNIEINLDTFYKGVNGAIDGSDSELSDEQTATVMQEFQDKMQKAAAELAQVQAEENVTAGTVFLEENAKKEGVTVLESGLQYKIIKSGEGKSPSETDEVETHYEGKLIDGTIFDSSYQRGETTSFPVNRVIKGWTEALQLMKEGDVWELVIPSDLAYGNQGAGGLIGPGATLQFKVELVTVK